MQTDLQQEALLNLDIRLATTPGITIVNTDGVPRSVATLQAHAANGFTFELDALLSYNALTRMLNTFLQGKRLELTEGLINQYLILEGCQLDSSGNDLIAKVPFSGSYTGILYLKGTPFYDTATPQVELQQVTYELETKSLLLKGVKWIFGKLILEEIKKYTSVSVARLYDVTAKRLNTLLNKQWAKGVEATGVTENITITGIVAQPQQLLIKTRCSGTLQLTVSAQAFDF